MGKNIRIDESQLRRIITESICKILKENAFDEDDIVASNNPGISRPTGQFRVKYDVREEDPNAHKYANKWGYIDPSRQYDIKTKIENFSSKDEALNFFNQLKDNGSVIRCSVEELKDTLIGEMWDDVMSF